MANTRLYLPEYQTEIDLIKDFPIEIEYSISDVRNIETRKKTFSKTVKIPGSNNNNILFKNIFDISSDTLFNVNKKVKCVLYSDEYTILDGYFQLREILTENIFSDDIIGYTIVLFGTNADFFDSLKGINSKGQFVDKKITDLISLSSLTHTYSTSNIVNSWSHTDTDGYVYPFIDYAKTQNYDYWQFNTNTTQPSEFEVYDFRPALFGKWVLDKIFEEAGYTYKSNFLNSNTFKKIILPHYKKDLIQVFDSDQFGFRASLSAATSFVYSGLSTTTGFISPFNPLDYIIPFDDTTTGINFSSTSYNESNYTYTTAIAAPIQITAGILINWTLSGSTSISQIRLNFGIVKNNSFGGNIESIILTGSSGTIDVINTTLINVQPTDEIKIYLLPTIFATGGGLFNLTLNLQPNINKSFWSTNAFGNYQYELLSGNTVDFNLLNITDLTQIEYIKEISKLFNLYFEPSKEDSRKLIVEPRDSFYQKDNIIDWTDKVDIKTVNQELLPDLQNKTIKLKYDYDQNDLLQFNYLTINDDEYGEKEINVDNDFLQGIQEIKSKFSLTPFITTRNSSGIYFSQIKNKDFQSFDTKPRILFYDGLITLNPLTYFNFDNGLKTSYPRALHLSNPLSFIISEELAFENPLYYNYLQFSGDSATFQATNKNLYNKYWKNTIDEITSINSRLVSAKINLNESDVSNFTFRQLIKIKNQLFRVNKIRYQSSNLLSNVELIRVIKNTDIFEPQLLTFNITNITYSNIINGNYVNGGDNLVLGKQNRVDNNNSLLIGKNNLSQTFGSKDNFNFIVGNNNSTVAQSSVIIGNNNIISEVTTGSTYIVGIDNVTGVTESGLYLPSNYKTITPDGVVITTPSTSVIYKLFTFDDVDLNALAFDGTSAATIELLPPLLNNAYFLHYAGLINSNGISPGTAGTQEFELVALNQLFFPTVFRYTNNLGNNNQPLVVPPSIQLAGLIRVIFPISQTNEGVYFGLPDNFTVGTITTGPTTIQLILVYSII